MISPIEASLIELMHVSDAQTCNGTWLEGAAESVSFLKENHARGDDVVVFASSENFFVYSILAPSPKVLNPDHEDLKNFDLMPHYSWSAFISRNGKNGTEQLTVDSPLDNNRCKSIIGGEKLIYERSINDLNENRYYIEISQKFSHLLNLHFYEDRQSYCGIDDRGNIEEVIRIYLNDRSESWKGNSAVTIKRKYLDRYLALTNMSMISRFNIARCNRGSLSYPWSKTKSETHRSNDSYFVHQHIPKTISAADGYTIYRSSLTEKSIIDELKGKSGDEKKYACFKIHDRKNGKYIETSCSPNHIVNYFDKSDLPWEISPAFFDPEVLIKYRSDTDKYLIESGGIECKSGWYLRSYEINDARQVYAFIGDLAKLPYREQLYWSSFSQWPKAGVTRTTIERDYIGTFPSEDNSLESLKSIIRELDRVSPPWWNCRGDRIISDVQVPATESIKGWGSELLSLDQAVIEGFRVKSLRSIIKEFDESFDFSNIGSIGLLEAIISDFESDKDKAKALINPFRELHHLRSIVPAHSSEKAKKSAVSKAIREHGDVRDHFQFLLISIRDTMVYLVDMLSEY